VYVICNSQNNLKTGKKCVLSSNNIINVKKILAVINTTYAVAKRKPEKIKLAGIRTLTSAILIFSGFLFATA